MWQQFRADYLSLCHYLPRRDRDLMEFPVLLHEQRIILFALRQLQSGRPFPAPPSTGLGSLNWKALYACTDLDGLIAAADKTIFAPALRRLRPAEGGLPDYTRTEVLLHSVYFSHMYRVIHRNYTGETERVLLRSYGEQIDLMNLMHILRLKAFFPQVRDYLPLLFPSTTVCVRRKFRRCAPRPIWPPSFLFSATPLMPRRSPRRMSLSWKTTIPGRFMPSTAAC